MRAIRFIDPHLLWFIPAALLLLVAAQLFSRGSASRVGKILSFFLRTLLLCIGLVALAGPQRPTIDPPSGTRSLIILSDRSESISGDAAEESARSVLNASLGGTMPVHSFDFAASLSGPGDAPPDSNETNIERCLDELSDRISDLHRSDVVLLTDGRSTQGEPIAGATRLALRGVHLHVLPVGITRQQPPHVLDVQPPCDARVGVTSSVAVTIGASNSTNCMVTLIDPSGTPVETRTLPIYADGRSTAVLRFVPTTYGLNRYSLRVEDQAKVTDQKPLPVFVESPPRLLLVDNFPDELAPLQSALAGLKLPIDVIRPEAWPGDLDPYAAIVMSDFSGKELTDAQRAALREYVERDGGGLVFIAGANVVSSMWAANPLAGLLPIKILPPKAKIVSKAPDISVCFVLDKSGSMAEILPGTTGGVSKLELVKASVINSIQSLPESANITVVAFDSQADVVVPPTSVRQREAIANLVDSIGVGGGTNIYTGIDKGIDLLSQIPGKRYLIVLTDGQTERPASGGALDVADIAAQHQISWTSVAVGSDADQDLLHALANRHGGRYAYCDTGDSIPQVFVQETNAIKRRSQIRQMPFSVKPGPAAEELGRLSAAEFPNLAGRVLAEPKPGARVELISGDHSTSDVLLADWQFGAGRVIAFASDVKSAWAGEWLRWPSFAQFWGHAVSSVVALRPPLRASVRSMRNGGHLQYTFEATDDDGRAAENLDCSATINPSPSPPISVQWRRLRPGCYRADLDLPPDQKTYDIGLMLRRSDRRSIQYHASVTASANQELAATGPDLQACTELAIAGSGVCDPNVNNIIDAISNRPDDPSTVSMQPLWPWLLMILVSGWPIDVWVRKL